MVRDMSRWNLISLIIGALWLTAESASGARINQEGRILGAAPLVTNPILFNTLEADAILSAMQIFPLTSAWNEDISRRPLLTNSDAMIAQINADLSSTRRTLRGFYEMNFVLVPDTQPLVPIAFVDYPDESDPSPYPLPSDQPIECWPNSVNETLQQWQQDTTNIGGDRHSITVQPGAGFIWETWQCKSTNSAWQASNGARFDLNSNTLRPAGWTSGDAAGLPMFPALVRYDECARGMVEHACRLVVKRTRREYIYPANHYASTTAATFTNVPAMGQRLRLKSSFVIPPIWGKEEQAVLLGLKKYGAIVADNGGFFSISITPDDRWPANAFSHLSTIGITNFEVIQTTGRDEGPRSPGAPQVSAGANQVAALGVPVSLHGFASYTAARTTTRWALYSGPAPVAFSDATHTNTDVMFNAPGLYTLLLSASDDVHAAAYDSVVITVSEALRLVASETGTNLNLNWTGGLPPFAVERAESLTAGSWTTLLTTSNSYARLQMTGPCRFFRIKSQ
jgi:hypothetical protein